jgi:hypothetical protein
MNILPLGHLVARELRQNPKRMSAKVIPLSLQQARRQPLAPVPVEKGERSAECRGGDSETDGFGDDVAPGLLGFVDCLVEEFVKQQVFQIPILFPGR